MILPDVNVLVLAYREDTTEHAWCRPWLAAALEAPEPVALADPSLAGFLRIVTHARIFDPPAPVHSALEFVDALVEHPNTIRVRPTERQWQTLTRLCRDDDATGNLVPDAYLAACAIDSGAELITTDRDYARFRGLRWRHPLDA